LVSLLVCTGAQAAVYNAVATGDATAGQCGLNEAVYAANGTDIDAAGCGPASPGTADVVNVAAGYYAEPGGLFVNDAVDIRGAGSGSTTIDASGTPGRVFLLAAGPVSIRDVTLRGGTLPDAGSGANALNGGGIWAQNGVSLSLERVVVTGNATGKGGGGGPPMSGQSPGAGGSGGGIYAQGPLTITDSTISSNTTGAGGSGAPDTGATGAAAGDGGGVYATGTLTITGSRITSNSTGAGGAGADGGSSARSGGDGGDGGGIRVGGAATITNTAIAGNHTGAGGHGGSASTASGEGGPGGDGGGIQALASLTLAGTSVADNTSGAGGAAGTGSGSGAGGRGGFGAGIRQDGGPLTISESGITGNRTGAGAPGHNGGSGGVSGNAGGVFADAFAMPTTIARTTISGNTTGPGGAGGSGTAGAGGLAGGIYGAGTQLTITDSTISGNATGNGGSAQQNPAPGGRGGGLAFESGQPLSVTNVTIAGNSTGAGGDALAGFTAGAGSGSGAGAYLGSSGAMTFRHVTVAGNQSGQGGVGVSNGGPGNGGGVHAVAGTLNVAATVFAGNGPGNCSTVAGGTLADGGHNISFPDATCPGGVADPLLGALAANGGATQTMALSAGSAAIDIVPADASCPAADQRGVARPVGAACDAGAFEYQPPATTGPGPGGGARDTTPPHVRLLLTKQRLRRALRRGYFVRFTTDEPGSAELAVFANSRVLAAKSVRVARGKLRAAKVGRNRVVARFTKKARRRLGKRRSVRLRVALRVADAAGNVTTKSARVKLKR
jgi:hypothetical protein